MQSSRSRSASLFCWQQWTLSAMWKLLKQKSFYSCVSLHFTSHVIKKKSLISGRAHLREALLRHEESQRLHRMCRELKGKAALAGVLKKSHSRALEAYSSAEEEDDFRELLDPPDILGTSICCVCVCVCVCVHIK